MIVTVTEHLADVAHDVDVAHGQVVFTLDPADGARSHLGHALVRVAAPVARHEGIALIVGDEALLGIPDPVRILVRSAGSPDPIGPSLTLRRRALPIVLRVEVGIEARAWPLRRVAKPEGWFPPQEGIADEPVIPDSPSDDRPGTADEE